MPRACAAWGISPAARHIVGVKTPLVEGPSAEGIVPGHRGPLGDLQGGGVAGKADMLGVVTKVDFGQIGGFKPGDRFEHLQQRASQALQIPRPGHLQRQRLQYSVHAHLPACMSIPETIANPGGPSQAARPRRGTIFAVLAAFVVERPSIVRQRAPFAANAGRPDLGRGERPLLRAAAPVVRRYWLRRLGGGTNAVEGWAHDGPGAHRLCR